VNQDTISDNPSTPSQDITPTKAAIKSAARVRVEKIRSELNVEKWPAIWQPAKSKNKPALRVMERQVTAADGNRVVSRVEVGYTQLGTLTTEEQKTLYVLIKLWEDSGKPDAQVFFSSRGLARMLKKKGWGTNVIHAITKSLRKLRTIPIEWINSYYDATKQGAVVVDRRPFTLLGELRVVERRQDGAVNSSQGYFKFDDHVLTNLQLNYTKPVCIEEFFKLKSEIAQLIYSHIDLMLFDKSKYERRTKELFDDLGLKNGEYAHMYERKRAVAKALKELNGIRLSSGVLKNASIEKTADGKDYKVSFSKGAAGSLDAASTETLPEAAGPGVVVNDYSKAKDHLAVQAETLVKQFYRLFHNVDSHQPRSKETAQALSLITQYGIQKANHVVEFALATSSATNYAPQTFGGILNYTSRALAEYDRQHGGHGKAVQAQPKAIERSRPEQEPRIRGELRLAALTRQQIQARMALAKAALKQNPFMARQPEGSKIYESTIRARMIRDLDGESMDLAIFIDLTITYPWYRPPAQNLPL
jgi:hypothetical protein